MKYSIALAFIIPVLTMVTADSAFNDEIDDHILEDNGTYRSVVKGKVKTDIKNIKNVLKDEMEEMSPELHEKIATSIDASDIDRSKYRDIFLIKKRIITDGDRQVVTFDIQERLIPKEPSISQLGDNSYTTYIFIAILFLLSGLVFTTTVKMYQNLINLKLIQSKNKSEI